MKRRCKLLWLLWRLHRAEEAAWVEERVIAQASYEQSRLLSKARALRHRVNHLLHN